MRSTSSYAEFNKDDEKETQHYEDIISNALRGSRAYYITQKMSGHALVVFAQ